MVNVGKYTKYMDGMGNESFLIGAKDDVEQRIPKWNHITHDGSMGLIGLYLHE